HWQRPFRTQLTSEPRMPQIADTKTPQGIIAVVPMPESTALDSTPHQRANYLQDIQAPGNLCTNLRTTAWFGNIRWLLSAGSVDPYNPKVVRSSMGAIFHAPLELDVELDSLPGRFQRIACLDMHGDSLQSAGFKTFDCYLFGNEARGVPREQLSALGAKPFTIAGSGAIESLNLATTVNICAYELNR